MFFDRIRRSIEILRNCWDVLKQDKELMLFPVMSFIALIALFVIVFVPLATTLAAQSGSGETSPLLEFLTSPWGLIPAYLFFILMYFIMIFFQAALIGCALMRLQGDDPTVSDGFKIGMVNIKNIAGWTLISATVGFLIHIVSSLFKGKGAAGAIVQVLMGIAGFSWAVLTYLVVPTLIIERISPKDAIARSAELLKKTWGEQLIGSASLGIIFFLLGLVALPLVRIGRVAAIGLALAYWLTLGIISTTLGGIYRAAIYRYAVTGKDVPGFNQKTLSNAFHSRGDTSGF